MTAFSSFICIVSLICVWLTPALSQAINRAGWSITADSTGGANAAANAIDGSTATFWESGAGALPHRIQVDMKQVFVVNSVSYLPRQDIASGRYGSHTVEVSTDNVNWVRVAIGTYFNDAKLKKTFFAKRQARYVRFIANSDATGGSLSSVSDFNVFGALESFTAPNPTKGLWKQTVDFPLVPAAAAIVPQNGKVLVWSANKYDDFNSGGGQTISALYDIGSGSVTQKTVSNTGHDMFCPGISMDTDGRIIVTGGSNAGKTSIYSFGTDSWTAGADMKTPRGYQSSVTTSQGKIFTIGGSWSGGVGNKNGEIHDPIANTWTSLAGCPVAPAYTADREGVYKQDNHMWLFGWKSASVFQAGPSKAMNWYGTTSTGSRTAAGLRSTDTDAMNGNAVMYDAAAGKILTVGGALHYTNSDASNRAYIITLGAVNVNPTVTTTGSMANTRAYHNSVVLPDGKVLVLGGQKYAKSFTDEQPALVPEIWDPATGVFTALNAHTIPRTYHSTALLLLDGTVLLGGGGLCGGCSVNHFDAEIFEPPYLFNSDGSRAARPVINSVSATSIAAGSSLTVATNIAVSRFSLIRLSSATHAINTDQRRIALTPTGSQTGYTITVPSDKGISNPGYYMLFAVTAQGVPSTSRMIRVT